jgi:signal transduction histidine kinase
MSGAKEDETERLVTMAQPIDEGFFLEMKQLVGFSPSDSRLLHDLLPELAPHLGAITDMFCRSLFQHESVRSLLTSPAQIARLKLALVEWLRLLLAGPHDESYFGRRWELGLLYTRLELPERYFFGAMNVIRRGLFDLLDAGSSRPDREAARDAVEKMLDIDLAIIAESYRWSYCEKMKRQDRLASIGRIAASVNHELRNPLSVIGSSVHALKDALRRGEEASQEMRAHFAKIERNLQRACKIAGDLLELTRECVPERRPVDVRELLQESLDQVGLPASLVSRVVVHPQVSRVTIDPDLIARVLVNLIQNARDAMTGSGTLELRAWREETQVRIEVADSGEGIPADDLELIFEPLYTTKVHGTGLGLPISRSIVVAHGGSLTVRSEPGKGSIFTITLPLEPRSPC